MAVSFVAMGTAVANGSASTVSVSITPVLPTGIASGDRDFLFTVSTVTVTTPAGWTQDVNNVSLGTGTLGSGVGVRLFSVFHRDYDGVWTAPAVATVSAAAPTIVGAHMAFRRGIANETWDPVVFGSGSDTTSGTGFSITTASTAWKTDGIVVAIAGFPASPSTHSAGAFSASGVTFGTATSRNAVTGSATGNGAFLFSWSVPITVGVPAAATFSATLGVAQTGGAVLFQVSSIGPVTPALSNAARMRAASW